MVDHTCHCVSTSDPQLCSFSKSTFHSCSTYEGFFQVCHKEVKLFSPFKTITFNGNLLLHNLRASPFHNKWLPLGLFLISHLRHTLVGSSVEIPGAGSQHPRPLGQCAQFVPSDAAPHNALAVRRAGRCSCSLLAPVSSFITGKASRDNGFLLWVSSVTPSELNTMMKV